MNWNQVLHCSLLVLLLVLLVVRLIPKRRTANVPEAGVTSRPVTRSHEDTIVSIFVLAFVAVIIYLLVVNFWYGVVILAAAAFGFFSRIGR